MTAQQVEYGDKSSFRINRFPFLIRQAMQVAMAVAEEVENNYNSVRGIPFGERRVQEIRPVLLAIPSAKRGNFTSEAEVAFKFERGVEVKVFLYDLSLLADEKRPEEWVATRAIVRFYELDKNYNRISEIKKEEVWQAEKLSRLKEVRGWWHPYVKSPDEICSTVGVFFDRAAGDGYVEPDFVRNQEGFYTLCEQIQYGVLVPGDKKRAMREAQKILAGYK